MILLGYTYMHLNRDESIILSSLRVILKTNRVRLSLEELVLNSKGTIESIFLIEFLSRAICYQVQFEPVGAEKFAS